MTDLQEQSIEIDSIILLAKREFLAKCIAAVEAIPEDPYSSAEWERDYDFDETGQTRNPRIWLREATSALRSLLGNDFGPDAAATDEP